MDLLTYRVFVFCNAVIFYYIFVSSRGWNNFNINSKQINYFAKFFMNVNHVSATESATINLYIFNECFELYFIIGSHCLFNARHCSLITFIIAAFFHVWVCWSKNKIVEKIPVRYYYLIHLIIICRYDLNWLINTCYH